MAVFIYTNLTLTHFYPVQDRYQYAERKQKKNFPLKCCNKKYIAINKIYINQVCLGSKFLKQKWKS